MNQMTEIMDGMTEKMKDEEGIRNTPVFRSMVLIRDTLRELGMHKAQADTITSNLTINVNEALYEFEEEGIALVKQYARMIHRIFTIYDKEFPGCAVAFCKDVSLEYKA